MSNRSTKLGDLVRKGTVAIHLFSSVQRPEDLALLTERLCGPTPASVNYRLQVPRDVLAGTAVWGGRFVDGPRPKNSSTWVPVHSGLFADDGSNHTEDE